ncbi:zinc ribbon domain-containing protein, partial [Bifidobacterium sp. SO1]|uniref:transposase n=1 Tax=Bifidobacterium sp. SO1 TaxID=2809029 RepID=UPI001BDCD352
MMPSKPDKVYSAYKVGFPVNAGKTLELKRMLPVWRQGLKHTLSVLERTILTGGKKPRWVDAKTWDGGLSQRQWDSVTRQAKAMLDSWIELREIDFRHIVSGSTIDDRLKRELYRINLRHAWWEPGDDPAHKMARRIIKHLRKRIPFPNPMHCRTMSMDGKIAQIQPSMKGSSFYYWARISTLTKNQTLYAPLVVHSDLEPHLHPNDPETLANHLQVRVNEDGTVTALVMTTQDTIKPRDTGETIGLDWGLNSLFATSDGRLYGLKLYAWLKQRDDELTILTKELARSNIPYKQSRRYRNLNRRIREYVKNETNRVLNIIADDTLQELVIEDLDFRHGGLSKRMNRIISRAGRATVRYKLQRLNQTHGIIITQVNPAYTSQECGSCGWTSEKNRPTQSQFHCECCGRKLNA